MSKYRQKETRRSHRLTRLGFHFLFVGTFAMLGGALRGFNLLLVLAGLMVGALIMQWRWSRRSVESVSVQRRLPTEAFAGRPFRVRYRLHNHGRLMPVWMMRVEEKIERAESSDNAIAICGAGTIAPQQTVVPHFDCTVHHRGVYLIGNATLQTTFPFALFTSRQIVEGVEEMCVFPRLLTLKSRWQRQLTSRTGGVTVTARRSGPTEGDFFGLREWQTGDSPKWIHWRTTARIGEPAVRQFEQQRRFDTCVLLDGFAGPSLAAGSKVGDVETAISLAATFLIHLVGSPSNRVVLAIGATEANAVIGGGSQEGKRRMLSLLAELVPCVNPELADAANQVLHMVGRTQDLIVVSPRSMKQVLESDTKFAETIQPWLRRGAVRWIDVGSAELDRWVVRDASGDPQVSEQGDAQRRTGVNEAAPAETLAVEVNDG